MSGDKAGGFWLVFVQICVMMWCSCGWIWVPTGSQRAVGRSQAGRHWMGGLGLPSGDVALGIGCDGLLRSLARV